MHGYEAHSDRCHSDAIIRSSLQCLLRNALKWNNDIKRPTMIAISIYIITGIAISCPRRCQMVYTLLFCNDRKGTMRQWLRQFIELDVIIWPRVLSPRNAKTISSIWVRSLTRPFRRNGNRELVLAHSYVISQWRLDILLWQYKPRDNYFSIKVGIIPNT